MSPIDSLAEWYRQKALRRLPRAHPIEGPYNSASEFTVRGDLAVMAVVAVVGALIVTGVVG